MTLSRLKEEHTRTHTRIRTHTCTGAGAREAGIEKDEDPKWGGLGYKHKPERQLCVLNPDKRYMIY